MLLLKAGLAAFHSYRMLSILMMIIINSMLLVVNPKSISPDLHSHLLSVSNGHLLV